MSTVWGSFTSRCRCGAGIQYEINMSQDDLPMLSEPIDVQALWDQSLTDQYDWGPHLDEPEGEPDEELDGSFTFGEMEEAGTEEANEQPENHQAGGAQPQREEAESEEAETEVLENGHPEA